MKTTRTLATLLITGLMVALLSLTTFAEGDYTPPLDTSSVENWTAIDTSEDYSGRTLNGGGYYYLTGDVELSNDIVVARGKTLHLDLNGHTLTGSGSSSVIRIKGALNLYDSAETGCITGGKGEKISGNTRYGGGILVEGTFNMYGGSIVGNEANTDGGGVYVKSGQFNMYDGTITNNTAEENGGGIYVKSGEFHMSGGSIVQNTAGEFGGGVYQTGTFKVSGSPVVTDNHVGAVENGVYLPKGKKIQVVGEVEDGADIVITPAVTTVGTVVATGSVDTTAFRLSTLGYDVEANSGDLVIAEVLHHCDGMVFRPLIPNQDGTLDCKILSTGNYYLISDVTMTGYVELDDEADILVKNRSIVNLCLNGHTITGSGDSVVIRVKAGGMLNLYDCSEDAGIITGGIGEKIGGSTRYGGGLLVQGTLNMYGGTITGNGADQNGGGVYVDKHGSFTMYGGAITGNTADEGDGIYNLGALNVSGQPNIADEIFLSEGTFITFNSAYSGGVLTVSTEIAPTEEVPVVVTSGASTGDVDVDDFITDKSYYTIAEHSGEVQLELTAPPESYTVSGTVTGGSNASVTLMHGNVVVDATVADGTGNYSFLYVAPGTYNVVATKDGKTVTVIVVLTDAPITNADATISNYSSHLVIAGEETPNVVVGGLDSVATTKGGTITLTVESKDDTADHAGDIQTATNRDAYTFLSIDLKDSGNVAITDTASDVLTIVVPYDFTGKTNVTVYRYHGGVDTFMESNIVADGNFYCDRSNHLLYIYTTKFSTYAVAHTVPRVPVAPTVSGGGGGNPNYNIKVVDSDNGRVTVSKTMAPVDTVITITTQPNEGYVVRTVTATDAAGKEMNLAYKGNGVYTYAQPKKHVTVTATFVPESDIAFEDVDIGDWFYEAVQWAKNTGVTTGTDDANFGPNEVTTRGQAVTFLWRAAGEPQWEMCYPFGDVDVDAWYSDAVYWAKVNGVTDGTSEETFSPDMNCTRAHIITFLWRMMGEPVAEGSNPFADVDTEDYYYHAVLWAVSEGITDGVGETEFSPNSQCNRAQIVTFLYRALNK